MVQPIDYMINAPSPVDRFGQGLLTGQQSRAQEMNMQLAQSQEVRTQTEFDQAQQDRARALQEQEAQKIAALKMQADLIGLGEKVAAGQASFNDFAQFSILYPDVGAELKGVWDGLDERRRKSDAAGLFKAGSAIKTGRPDLAAQMLEEYAVAAENGGQKIDADMARATAALIKSNPDAGLANIGLLLHSLDPEGAKALFGEGKSVQSNVTLDDGTTITTFDDGTKQVADAAGRVIEGQAAIDAVRSANEYGAEVRRENAAGAATGRLETAIDLGGQAKAAEEAGKQAVAKSGDAFDTLGKVNQNIRTIDEAIAAIDAGANAGAVARYFPNVSSASASLENAMNRLGLDVISSVTFGALSEGEMRLAMETAVPRNLDEASLRKWLEEKRVAQEKASEALYNAAIYLGTPGNTLAGWLKEQKASGQGSQPQGAASGASQPQGQTVIDGYSIEEVP